MANGRKSLRWGDIIMFVLLASLIAGTAYKAARDNGMLQSTPVASKK